jgi:hypothetical protein
MDRFTDRPHRISSPRLIPFPARCQSRPRPATNEGGTATRVQEKQAKIQDASEDTSGALQELRHGVIYVLFDTLEMINMDAKTLSVRIDEPIRVVGQLKQREADRLTTERLIEILEKLRPLLRP